MAHNKDNGTAITNESKVTNIEPIIIGKTPNWPSLGAQVLPVKKWKNPYDWKDGIVIAINTQNQVSDLSDEQLQGIFSGKITNWNQVGGSDGEINVITREEGSGTLDAFESIVMGDSKIKDDAVVQSSTEAVKQSVSQDPNAIGFVSYAHMSDDIKAVNVNGVAPSDATIADGTYELQRPFLFLTNGEPTGETKNFIDWVLSDDGGKVLADEKIIKTSK